MNPESKSANAPQPSSASLKELQEIRRQMTALNSEIAGLRSDLRNKKTLAISDQVAKGVVIGSIFMAVVIVVLQVIVGRLV